MWGKLTEHNKQTKTKIILDPQELYRFLVTPGIEVTNLIFASEHVVWTNWRFTAEEKAPNLSHTNEVIGACVIAGAHIHLYSYLDRLQKKVLYCDTDSNQFIQNETEPQLVKCGDNLGDMTDELKPGEYTSEFVSGGSKNYAYIRSATAMIRNLLKLCVKSA
jgi:hypothetical protein